jgi:hypothetical protein
VILSFELRHSGPIEVVDGDTVRLQGMVYRGFDISERGDKARCDYSSLMQPLILPRARRRTK